MSSNEIMNPIFDAFIEGNTNVPNIGGGIQFYMLHALVNRSSDDVLDQLSQPLTHDELENAKERVHRLHAAFSIRWPVESKLSEEERLRTRAVVTDRGLQRLYGDLQEATLNEVLNFADIYHRNIAPIPDGHEYSFEAELGRNYNLNGPVVIGLMRRFLTDTQTSKAVADLREVTGVIIGYFESDEGKLFLKEYRNSAKERGKLSRGAKADLSWELDQKMKQRYSNDHPYVDFAKSIHRAPDKLV